MAGKGVLFRKNRAPDAAEAAITAKGFTPARRSPDEASTINTSRMLFIPLRPKEYAACATMATTITCNPLKSEVTRDSERCSMYTAEKTSIRRKAGRPNPV